MYTWLSTLFVCTAVKVVHNVVVAVARSRLRPFTHAFRPLFTQGVRPGCSSKRLFCLCYGCRQSASANGPAWAALKKHRRPRLRRGTASRGATPLTAGAGFNSRGWGRLKAAQRDTAQVNLPPHTLSWGRGWVCREPRGIGGSSWHLLKAGKP
jgi:hypothetical protein